MVPDGADPLTALMATPMTVYEAAVHGRAALLEGYLRGDPALCGPTLRYVADTRDNAGRTLLEMVRDDAPHKTVVMEVVALLLKYGAKPVPM